MTVALRDARAEPMNRSARKRADRRSVGLKKSRAIDRRPAPLSVMRTDDPMRRARSATLSVPFASGVDHRSTCAVRQPSLESPRRDRPRALARDHLASARCWRCNQTRSGARPLRADRNQDGCYRAAPARRTSTISDLANSDAAQRLWKPAAPPTTPRPVPRPVALHQLEGPSGLHGQMPAWSSFRGVTHLVAVDSTVKAA